MNRKCILMAAATSALCGSALAGTFASITIDGTFSDWASVPSILVDPVGDGNPIDFGTISIANDNANLYVRVEYNTPTNPNIGPAMYFAFDTDQNVATGYNIYGMNVVGSEAAFQGDFPFDQRTGYNVGGLTAGGLVAPVDWSDPAAQIVSQEYAFPRDVKYTSDNATVFANPAFNLMLWTDSSLAVDTTTAMSYTFANQVIGWSNPGSGDWNSAANWSYGTVPNAAGALAELRGAITAPATVYSNSAITVGSLIFENSNMYVVAGAGTLTLDAPTTAVIDVLQGSHKINLPTVFQSNTNITVASGNTLTLADPVTIKANKTVSKTGTVVISAPLVLESGAVMNSAGATTVYGAPSLAFASKINVSSGNFDIDYRGIATPADTIRQQLKSGYNNGAWNGDGINTSAAVAGQVGLGWVDDSANQNVKVRIARYGDANLSGTVDSTDFNAFIAGYGKTTDGVWAGGDFNYDQKVSTLDFNLLAGNFGQSTPAPALGSVVPEPASLGLLSVASLMIARRRRG